MNERSPLVLNPALTDEIWAVKENTLDIIGGFLVLVDCIESGAREVASVVIHNC